MPDTDGTVNSESVKASFTKKMGPLPAYGWAAIVIVLIVGYRLYKKRSTPTASALPTSAFGGTGDASSNGGNAGNDQGSGSSTSAPIDVTNATWGSTAANWEIGRGKNAVLVNSAISKYLNGGNLTLEESMIISEILAQFGTPPSGVLPINVNNTPPATIKPIPVPKSVTPHAPVGNVPRPKPPRASHPTTPPTVTHYTVKPGDNLTAISIRFYHHPDWQKIYNANKGVIGGDPNLIKPGQILVIPA